MTSPRPRGNGLQDHEFCSILVGLAHVRRIFPSGGRGMGGEVRDELSSEVHQA